MTQTTAPVLFPPFLLATDGSPSAHLAQKLLATIAQTLHAQQHSNGRSLVTVLTVQPRRSSRSKRLTPPAPSHLPSNHLQEDTHAAMIPDVADVPQSIAQVPSEADLAATVQARFPADLPITVEVRQGRPAIEILNCARTMQAGLIGMGSRGTSNRLGRLMGSVSVIIARYAPCSVLVARGLASHEPSLRHLLLVVDDSPATRRAIATTQQLLPAGVQQVTILYAQPPLNADYLFGPFATPTPSWQLNQSLQDVQKEQSEQVLAYAKAALNAPGVLVHTLRQTGEPGPLICQIAQQQQADLIVLGGHAMRRWLRFPASETLLPLQSFRRLKPDSARPDDKAVVKPPALPNTRLSATEDYTLHHAPCPVLLCRSTPVVAH